MELYADRLARDAQRVADELAAARLRLAWAEFEVTARDWLGGDDSRLLEAIGVLRTAVTGDDAALVDRRQRQLGAIGRYQAFVEEQLDALRGAR